MQPICCCWWWCCCSCFCYTSTGFDRKLMQQVLLLLVASREEIFPFLPAAGEVVFLLFPPALARRTSKRMLTYCQLNVHWELCETIEIIEIFQKVHKLIARGTSRHSRSLSLPFVRVCPNQSIFFFNCHLLTVL